MSTATETGLVWQQLAVMSTIVIVFVSVTGAPFVGGLSSNDAALGTAGNDAALGTVGNQPPTPTPTAKKNDSSSESEPSEQTKPPEGLTSGVADIVGTSQDELSADANAPETVTVRINAVPGRGDDAAVTVRREDGRVLSRADDRIIAELPAAAVHSLRTVPSVKLIQLPERPETMDHITSEGVSVINASDLHQQGYTGENVTVAVIDLEQDFNASNPEIADNVEGVHDPTSGESFTNASSAGGHGSAVAETVVDVAPNVSLQLIEVETGVEIANAIDYARTSTNSDVIVMSLGSRSGPFDGSGFIGDHIETARSSGISMYVSAGNAGGGKHLNTTWEDPNSDDYLNYKGDDELLQVTTRASKVEVTVSWNDYPNSYEDYDVYLLNSSGSLADSSTNHQKGDPPEEFVSTQASECPCEVAIYNFSANGTADFDLFGNDGTDFEYNTSVRSTTRPATDEAAITVGAIYWDTLTLESFSSRGPTVDGRLKPEFTAPDGTTTSVYSSFFGTSASAPHAAGAAALLVGFNESLSPVQLESALKNTARQTDSQYTSPDPNVHTGYGLINVQAALNSLRDPLFEEWQFDTGSRVQFAQAATDADQVFVGGLNRTFYALDRSDGSLNWSYPRSGSLVDSSPTVANGMVYVGSGGGTINASNTTTSSGGWTYTTDSAVVSSPTVVGGTVYVGSNDGTVIALDANDGSIQWTYETHTAVYSKPAVAGGTVYISLNNGTLVALDAATGTFQWQFDTDTEVGHASPAVNGSTVYFAADNVYALDDASGSVTWQASYAGTAGASPTVNVSKVYVASADGTVTALRTSDGSTDWSYDTGATVYTTPAVTTDHLVVANASGGVHLFDPATGSVEATQSLGAPVYSAPHIDNDIVYIGTNDGRVYALRITK